MKWKMTLDLSPEYGMEQDKENDDEIDVKAISLVVHQRIKEIIQITPGTDDCVLINQISYRFLKLSTNPSLERFNDCMDKLYDWADINRVWVKIR